MHLANGLPNFTIVGLPEAAAKESKDRVRAASQSTLRQLICRKRVGASICPSRSASSQGEALLRQAISRFNLLARAYHHVLKLARSIADLAGSATIQTAHIAEAVQYRSMDKN